MELYPCQNREGRKKKLEAKLKNKTMTQDLH